MGVVLKCDSNFDNSPYQVLLTLKEKKDFISKPEKMTTF